MRGLLSASIALGVFTGCQVPEPQGGFRDYNPYMGNGKYYKSQHSSSNNGYNRGGHGRSETPDKSINRKQRNLSPHYAFRNRTGYSCDYKRKTILIQLDSNGAGTFQACENYRIQRHGVVSSGKPGSHDTVRGDFNIDWKAYKWDSKTYPSENGGYNMKRAQFFHKGFAIHNGNVNSYSHGCVRTQMKNADWLYNWGEIGTRLIVEDGVQTEFVR